MVFDVNMDTPKMPVAHTKFTKLSNPNFKDKGSIKEKTFSYYGRTFAITSSAEPSAESEGETGQK